jgi:hypothetical protein
MRNISNGRKNNNFVKRFAIFFIVWLLISVEECKMGSIGEARRLPTYYKPSPNSWQEVYECMPSLILFSICMGMLFAIVFSFFLDEK